MLLTTTASKVGLSVDHFPSAEPKLVYQNAKQTFPGPSQYDTSAKTGKLSPLAQPIIRLKFGVIKKCKVAIVVKRKPPLFHPTAVCRGHSWREVWSRHRLSNEVWTHARWGHGWTGVRF